MTALIYSHFFIFVLLFSFYFILLNPMTEVLFPVCWQEWLVPEAIPNCFTDSPSTNFEQGGREKKKKKPLIIFFRGLVKQETKRNGKGSIVHKLQSV